MEKILIFGTGSRAEKVLRSVDLDKYELLAFLDNNINKQGLLFHGLKIISPIELNSLVYDKIVICSTAYDEICLQLTQYYNVNKEKITDNLYFVKNRIFDYYGARDYDYEINDILDYLNENSLKVFNYEFINEYKNFDIDVFYDDKIDLYYVLYKGKRMYFSEKFKTEESVAEYYKFILMEQDINSPHRYLTSNVKVEIGDVVVDAGVAEGNFALDIIDIADKVYIIEMDQNWIKALRETFKEYLHKVVFINKYLSDKDDCDNITLDTLYKNVKFDFLKMDIEGYEYRALKGAEVVLTSERPLKLDVCTYHNYEDFNSISELLTNKGFHVVPSNGYMYFMNEDMYDDKEPHFVRGLIHSFKNI